MFIVVTRSTFSPDVEAEVLALAIKSVPIAKRQPGFIDMIVHINHARTQLMTYWKWDNGEAHEACMASDDWQAFMPSWDELISDGKLRFDFDSYEMLNVSS